MITANFLGGLGNQMFQIAAAYSLAKDNNDEVAFDFKSHKIKHLQGRDATFYRENIFSRLKTYNKLSWFFTKKNTYTEKKFSYAPIPYCPNLILNGYFQSEKYFINNKTEVISLFLPHNEEIVMRLNNIIEGLKERYQKPNIVSLHVRRGDYLKYPDKHRFVGIDYINKAMQHFQNSLFLVFSDDYEWCYQNIKPNNNTQNNALHFIHNTDGLKDYEEMWLMSFCNSNIISNSSFSWWGSYLNQNKNKTVIAPAQWLGIAFKDSYEDVYFNGMIKMD